MSYLKLLNSHRKSGRQPTMAPTLLTTEQKALADAGSCIECGTANPGANSYLCKECQGKETIEDIRGEIADLRRKLLNKS